jgi:transposase InsO family protein
MELGTSQGTVVRIAEQLGYGTECVHRWVMDAEVDAPGMSSAERTKMRKLEQENRGPRRSNEILKRASALFAAELDRPQIRDEQAATSTDPVDRDSTAEAPNRLRVTDLTYVPTWAGMGYACFIIDVFSRRIVGWRIAGHERTQMVLDTLEMARWARGTRFKGHVAHSDAGPTQYTSIRYGERLAEIGAGPSIGSVGDGCDNALAESVNSLYKPELIHESNQGEGRQWIQCTTGGPAVAIGRCR